MKQRTLYQVRVTQEIPFCDYDEDGEETKVSSGRIEEYVAGRFSAEHNAKLFAEGSKQTFKNRPNQHGNVGTKAGPFDRRYF